MNHTHRNKGKKLPSVSFVWGNSSNNLMDGSIAANETEKNKLFAYFTKNIPGGINIKYLIQSVYNIQFITSLKVKLDFMVWLIILLKI